jgi:hypothetical protein
MKFEIVDFYPYMRSPKWKKTGGRKPIGTVHVYWIDQEIDLRGIGAHISQKEGIYYTLPFLTNYNPLETRISMYPAFSFTCKFKERELEDFLKSEATPLVEKYLKENPALDKRVKNDRVVHE